MVWGTRRPQLYMSLDLLISCWVYYDCDNYSGLKKCVKGRDACFFFFLGHPSLFIHQSFCRKARCIFKAKSKGWSLSRTIRGWYSYCHHATSQFSLTCLWPAQEHPRRQALFMDLLPTAEILGSPPATSLGFSASLFISLSILGPWSASSWLVFALADSPSGSCRGTCLVRKHPC